MPFLPEALLFLALAGLLMPLLQCLHINQALGFLAAGAIVAPVGMGRRAGEHSWLYYYLMFQRSQGIAPLAELGVLFLMFMIGLELPASRLWGLWGLRRWGLRRWALRRWVIGDGAQVLLSRWWAGSR